MKITRDSVLHPDYICSKSSKFLDRKIIFEKIWFCCEEPKCSELDTMFRQVMIDRADMTKGRVELRDLDANIPIPPELKNAWIDKMHNIAFNFIMEILERDKDLSEEVLSVGENIDCSGCENYFDINWKTIMDRVVAQLRWNSQDFIKEENLENLVASDFSEYTQDDPAPTSFSKGSGIWLRHYELSECFGLIAYQVNHSIMIHQLDEDDCNWWKSERPISMASGWCKSIRDVARRMEDWLDENTEPLYHYGKEGEPWWICGHWRFNITQDDVKSNIGEEYLG